MSVTPQAGSAWFIAAGGTAVVAVPANPAGGFITNPLSNVGQGIDPDPAESIFIDAVGNAAVNEAGNTIFELLPGQNWPLIPGQTTPTYVNAVTTGHKFSVTYWP